MKIRLNHVLEKSKVQGPGERFTIWVQGCSIHCDGCSNKDTWPIDEGEEVTVKSLVKKVLASDCPGVTITGGEPLDQLEAILELSRGIFSFKDIFLCSGYEFETIRSDLQKKQILTTVDMICSGPFDKNQVCKSEWKGSKNQEVIYITKRGKDLMNLPVYRREYRIDKKTGSTLITGFSISS
jgi:anaerobic ribonucleoside-triphosphate reductase activating protein